MIDRLKYLVQVLYLLLLICTVYPFMFCVILLARLWDAIEQVVMGDMKDDLCVVWWKAFRTSWKGLTRPSQKESTR